MNEVQVVVVGTVCSEVRYLKTGDGVSTARFHVRSLPRRFDAKASAWSDGAPSYYWATCWRQLADHVAASVRSGDPVVLTGKLTIGRYKKGDERMMSATIDVQAIGHDLRWGTSSYQRGGGGGFVPVAASDADVDTAAAGSAAIAPDVVDSAF